VVRAQQAVVAHLVGSPGQDVLEKPAEEFLSVQGHGLPALVAGILVPEGHGPLVRGEDSPVGDGDAMDVPGQVLDDPVGTLDGGFAVDDPWGLPERLRETKLRQGLSSQGHEPGPEQDGKGLDRH